MLKDNIKFEDIDPDFLNFTPSRKLPEEVRSEFLRMHEINKDLYYLDDAKLKSLFLTNLYYFTLFMCVFSDDGHMIQIWNKLYKRSPFSTIKLANYFCNIELHAHVATITPLHIPNKLGFTESLKKQVISTIKLMNEAKYHIVTIGEKSPSHEEGESSYYIQREYHSELEKSLQNYLKKLDVIELALKGTDNSKNEKDFLYLKSRKNKIYSSEAIFFIRHISNVVNTLFDKRHHNEVSHFINKVFQTDYTGQHISDLVRDRKSVHSNQK